MNALNPHQIDRADIQGNLLEGYNYPNATYLFFEVPAADAGQAFLGALQPLIRTAERWDPDPKPATATNVAVTYAGLRILGVSPGLLDEMPPEFHEPIRERAPRLLGDRGPSAPEYWDEHVGTDRSHLVVSVFGRAHSDTFAAATAVVIDAASANGVTLVVRQDTTELRGRREHFGWADGFGQPALEGVDTTPIGGTPTANGTWSPVKLGEFVHGYPDEDGQERTGAIGDLLRDGTFMVWRKLHQDVVGFRAHLYAQAQAYGAAQPGPSEDPNHLYEVLAAKVVGRWRDGIAIRLAPKRPGVTNLGSQAVDNPPPDNDFRYLPEDRNGHDCPLGAHIRRTNPRDALDPAGASGMARRHRIIRRGMPYGPFLDFVEGQADDGQDRGLIFVCCNASIARQFEVVQQQWSNDGNAFGLGDERDHLLVNAMPGPGADPPVGAPAAAASMSVQGDSPFFVAPAPAPFVVTKGCEYLFVPGLRAVAKLADGEWSKTATSENFEPGGDQAIDRVVASAPARLQADDPPSV